MFHKPLADKKPIDFYPYIRASGAEGQQIRNRLQELTPLATLHKHTSVKISHLPHARVPDVLSPPCPTLPKLP